MTSTSPQGTSQVDMSKGIHLGLGRITALLRSLGDPHLATPIVHVAGTNGKGSVCAYLESMFRRSGLQVGRFTSPHLVEVRDCITIKGQTISRAAYEKAKQIVENANEKDKVQASSFEILTATAFLAFKHEQPPLDLAVIEVGMGGRTDATNVCPKPLATVITPIDMDHQAFLGNTPAEIASVKAGIIKEGVPCIVSPQQYPKALETIKAIATAQAAPLLEATPASPTAPGSPLVKLAYKHSSLHVHLPLQGAYQRINVATAVETVQAISRLPNLEWKQRLIPEAVKQGIEQTKWPGRLDWVQVGERDVLVDGAHNPASIAELQIYLASLPPKPLIVICSVSAPRDPAMLLDPLLSTASKLNIEQVIAVPFSSPEGMPWVTPVDPAVIVETAKTHNVKATSAETVLKAIEQASSSTTVLVCGSLYLVSDVYRLIGRV